MDIAFGTDGWRTTVDEFTAPRIRAVGQAVADFVHEEAGGPGSRPSRDRPAVAVGYDPRAGSRDAAEELCRVLCTNGIDAHLPERDTPTPVVAWTVRERDLAGALQVTASHNPASYNGIKFVPSDGAPALPAVTDRLADSLRPPDPDPGTEWGRVREDDFVEPYVARALAFASDVLDPDSGSGADASGDPLSGITIAHDAMHGSGRGVTDALLERAGATVLRLRADRDPEFGGGAPEPTAERLEDLARRVADGDAALGVANDGDADRIGVVTPRRGYVDPNWLFVALYDALLSASAGDAVRTVSTTFLVDRVAEAHGHAAHETPVGFKWVARAMTDHDALVGGEESGGFAVRGHVPNKDGVLVALLVALAHADEPLDDRLDRLRETYGDIVQDRVSVECPDDRKEAVLAALDGEIPDEIAGIAVEDVGTADGFKLRLADGSWLLVRPSGTEPKLRVYAEADSRERVDELLEAGRALMEPLV